MNEAMMKEFLIAFENLVDQMNDPEYFEKERFVETLDKICDIFHITKGVTEFYMNERDEKDGIGEILIDRDNGRNDNKVILCKRIVSKSKAVVKGTIYCSENQPPYSEQEIEKMDLFVRSVLSFVCRNRLQDAVERLAFYDADSYPNINYFMRYLDGLNECSKITGNTVMQFNLRQFSIINKEIGRALGDVVIRNYYNILQSVINDDGIVCRVGGDNFIAIFPTEKLQQVLRIIKGCPVPFDNNEKRIKVSAAAGIFVIPDDYIYERPGDIFGKVNNAMQDAKTEQRGSIIYHNEKNVEIRKKNLEIWRAFPEAIDNKEFKAFYQPKVDVNTGEIVGAEALCRWINNGRIIPPMDFIPMLEQNTDICTLDFYMLDIVCKDIMRWISQGRRPVKVSVNLSRKHLIDADLLMHIMDIIDNNNTPHEFIEIELTETTNDVEFKYLKRIVTGLQDEGISTSVDDFGIGYSSLSLIREIPWNILKIDKSFLPTGEDDNNITDIMFKHVISMAHDMGLECVTEGVETLDQINILKNSNCRIAQGFYFDKPLDVEEFEKKLDMHTYKIL